MTTSRVEMDIPNAASLSVSEDTLSVDLSDGRSVSVSLAWFPRLLHGTAAERDDWRLIGRGEGIHWEALDEDISIESLLAGRRSGESQESLKQWLTSRGTGTVATGPSNTSFWTSRRCRSWRRRSGPGRGCRAGYRC